MAFTFSEETIRETTRLGSLRPSRDATLIVVAAAGTLLLTTAEVQPLIPSEPSYVQAFTGASHVAPMGGAWEAVLVGLPLAACLGAVFRGWPTIWKPAGAGIAAIGIAAFLVNMLTVNSGISVLDIMTQRFEWPFFAPLLVATYFSCAATVWLAFARDSRDKRFASGILLATGVYGYLCYLQQLDLYVSYTHGGTLGPGRAVFAGMFGAATVLVAGVLAHAMYRPAQPTATTSTSDPALTWLPAAPAAPSSGPVRLAKAAASVATLAIIVACGYQGVFESRSFGNAGFGTTGLLMEIAAFVLIGVFPALLALAACLVVVGQRAPNRRFAAGVLLTGCLLSLAYFSASHIADWLTKAHESAGWLISSSDIGAGGGLLLALAGIALLVAGKDAPSPAEPARQAPDLAQPTARTQPEMTRYLCTAPHLDDRYARRVIEEVVVDPHRAVVPSLGIDMGIVIRHCFAARRRQNVRDALITMLLIITIPLIFFFHALIGIRDILLCLMLAGMVAFTDRWISRYRVTRQLTRERFDPAAGPWLTPTEGAQLAHVLAAEEGDISVYGTYNPFVGSGFSRGGWSFAVNLTRGKQSLADQVRLEPLPFDVDDFYRAVELDIMALDLAGLTVESRLLVDGQNIRDDRRFLPVREGRPLTGIGADRLLSLAREPELRNRTYQCIRLQAWDGDLVLSVFVNFTKRGSALLAEVQHYLLAPLQPDYRQADQLGSWSLGYQLRTELKSAPRAVTGTAIRAPFRLGRLIVKTGLHGLSERAAARRIKADPEYNFGAVTSVRELAQSGHYRRYFQQVDRDLDTKLIDRQILDTIRDFLDAHNVDISQFEEQTSMILNNGLLISGGEFKAGSVAVGSQARSGMTQISQGVQSILRPGGDAG